MLLPVDTMPTRTGRLLLAVGIALTLLVLAFLAWQLWRYKISTVSPTAPVSISEPLDQTALDQGATASNDYETGETNGSVPSAPVGSTDIASAAAPIASSAPVTAPGFQQLPIPLTPVDGIEAADAQISVYYPGSTQPIARDQVTSADRKLANQSDLIPVAPFDPQAFAADPEPYLQADVPGRIWQTAAPAPGIPTLSPVGLEVFELFPGASVELQVRSVSGAPVTFQTQGLGTFSNERTTITVRAADDGVARAIYRASPGAIADVPIIAASPMAMGQVVFHLFIADPSAQAP